MEEDFDGFELSEYFRRKKQMPSENHSYQSDDSHVFSVANDGIDFDFLCGLFNVLHQRTDIIFQVGRQQKKL